MKKNILLISAIAVVAGSAQASPTLTFLSVNQGQNLKTSRNNGSSFQSMFAGELKMRLINGSSTSDFLGFCGDITVTMGSGPIGTTITNSSALKKNGERIGYLVNKYAPGILGNGNVSQRKDQAAALQLTIWELLEENTETCDITAGSFRAKASNDGALSASINGFLNIYMNDIGSGLATYYKAPVNGNGQSVSQGVLTPVPEPATMATLGVGLVALGKRRKNRK